MTYTIQVWTALPGDSDTSNDTLTYSITPSQTLPFVEDFESFQLFPLPGVLDLASFVYDPTTGDLTSTTLPVVDSISFPDGPCSL